MNGNIRGRRNTQEDNAVACALRSWVQIPPVHFFLLYNYGINLSSFSVVVGQKA